MLNRSRSAISSFAVTGAKHTSEQTWRIRCCFGEIRLSRVGVGRGGWRGEGRRREERRGEEMDGISSLLQSPCVTAKRTETAKSADTSAKRDRMLNVTRYPQTSFRLTAPGVRSSETTGGRPHGARAV